MIRLYSYWRSSAAYRVRIALNLKELEYEIVPVSLAPDVAENRQAAYRTKNPQMLIPFFEDGNVAINQSMAILEYLEEAYPEIALLPADEPLRSRVRAFCNIIACDIHPLQNLRVQRYVSTECGGDKTAWTTHWISEGCKALEAFLGDGPYAFGDRITLADALLVPQVYNARRFNVPLTDFPGIVAAAAAAAELDAFQAAAPESQPDCIH